jgi:hypothetical protein
MRITIVFAVLLLGLVPQALAQTTGPDTVRLKDSSYYVGKVLEMVPGEHVVIKTPNGNVHKVPLSEVKAIAIAPPKQHKRSDRVVAHETAKARRDTMRYLYRPKGFFYQIGLSTVYKGARIQVALGYKFKHWAQVGGAIGIDLDAGAISYSSTRFSEYRGSGSYLSMPMEMWLHGDMLRSQITPFYEVQIGAGANISTGDPKDKFHNVAVIGGLGLGVRFHSRGKPNFNLGLQMYFKGVDVHYTEYIYNTATQRSEFIDVNERVTMTYLGLRIAIGI